MRRKPSRYRHLYRAVHKTKAKHIMEIGVFNAYNSRLMIETALIHHKPEDIHFYGFDLFEMMNDEIHKKEFSKRPRTEKEVLDLLEPYGINVHLYSGYTQKSLPPFVEECKKNNLSMDFIFIDGGHHIDTIKNDWDFSKQLMDDSTVTIFDDYYILKEPVEALKEAGCQDLIPSIREEGFNVEILNPVNTFPKEWGDLCIKFVRVTR